MTSPAPVATLRRAFTIVELLVVILIIVLLIALLVPVLSGVRKTAKATATRQLLNSIGTAASQFEISERRIAGYFTPAEMGDVENLLRGFSGMENLTADLAGGVVQTGTGGSIARVGPKAGPTEIGIDIGLIGASTQVKGVVNKGYWVPDAKNFIAQAPVGVPPGDGIKQASSVAAHGLLPDVVDYFGNPLLVWTQDDGPGSSAAFAAESYNARMQARFYWASNAAFLQATSLGQGGEDQNFRIGGFGSLLMAPFRIETMTGILGNPAFPVPNSTPAAPAAARGRLIIQSAGIDGVFLGGRDRGGRNAGAANYVVRYAPNIDPLENFDDLVHSAGN